MASAVLFLFSASIMMFQISCSKTASANNLGGASAGKMIYLGDQNKIYIKNVDGTGSTTILNIVLPSPYTTIKTGGETGVFSDGNYIYFRANDLSSSGSPRTIFRCNMQGQNVTKLTNEADISGVFSIY